MELLDFSATMIVAKKGQISLMRHLILLTLLLIAACSPANNASIRTPNSPVAAVTTDGAFVPTSAVTYPANYQTDFEHYVTIDRPDGTVRDIYINPEAVDALRISRRLPAGTVIVVEAYNALADADDEPVRDAGGRYIKGEPLDMVHVLHKRSDWLPDDFPGEIRNGDWNFGSFEFASGAPFDESLTACFNCHQAMPATDFLYSTRELLAYARADATQHLFCNLRRRIPCE